MTAAKVGTVHKFSIQASFSVMFSTRPWGAFFYGAAVKAREQQTGVGPGGHVRHPAITAS